jgi:formylglycine-generating enzyme required for sulfatase activity/serine/threonine protein kinase
VSDDLIGRHLGQYEIVEFIGGDDLTEVYRAVYHPEDDPLEREVSVLVKIVGRQQGEDPVFNTRFRREARAIAGLRHPNIVRVHDFGHAENGHYVIMDYIDGETLADVMAQAQRKERFLDMEDITFIIRQIASALDHAHSQGVVHRAVNPHTIIITRSGQAILADYGLSLLYSRSGEGESPDVIASPAEYMAPELVYDPRAATPASDVYSLGVILYQLLTGQLPFEFGSDIDMALQSLGETAPDPRLLNQEISVDVAAVTLKALAKEPKERFLRAMKMASALERAAYPDPRALRAYKRHQQQETIASRPTAERLVVHRGPPRREERRRVKQMRGEYKGIQQESGVEGVRVRRPLRLVPVNWLRWAAFATAVIVILIAGAFVLDALGIIRLPVGSSQLTVAEMTATAQATITPTLTPEPPTATPPPTLTPLPTPTPLEVAESTPVPALEYAPLGAGSSAFRVEDGAAIQFVPAGTFMMGSDDPERNEDAHPQHAVMLNDYWIDQTEVTNDQYALCVEAELCQPPISTQYYSDPNRGDHPVVYVTYTYAVTYCLWLSSVTGQTVGLPTEAQWEKAATWDPVAEEARLYPWGNEPPDGTLLRYLDGPVWGTAEVGSYPNGASAYGVYDMAGNVWEWTADWYGAKTYDRTGIPVDPTGPASGTQRINRGGGWAHSATYMPSAIRNAAEPTASGNDLGFRCAMAGNRPPQSSGMVMTPLDLVPELNERLDAELNALEGDVRLIDDWRAALDVLNWSLLRDDNEQALTTINDGLAAIKVQRRDGQISAKLAQQLEGGLQWIKSQIEPVEEASNTEVEAEEPPEGEAGEPG